MCNFLLIGWTGQASLCIQGPALQKNRKHQWNKDTLIQPLLCSRTSGQINLHKIPLIYRTLFPWNLLQKMSDMSVLIFVSVRYQIPGNGVDYYSMTNTVHQGCVARHEFSGNITCILYYKAFQEIWLKTILQWGTPSFWCWNQLELLTKWMVLMSIMWIDSPSNSHGTPSILTPIMS